ncbi:MAG: hydantoinase/oxoprolinase family protein, partial [Rhizobiales bacterium]|nr:hydantoinase/oxoprolinase family protein [Hyphomicrobiales bacterium]
RMRLDRDAAREAIRREVADPLGIGIEDAAAAIVELATEHMVQAILDITVNQGIDPSGAAFVAGGGAAGLNCVAIGRRLGCAEVLVPETGAALAAAGALVSDLAAHHQAMFYARSGAFDAVGVNAVLASLEARCRAFLEKTGPDAELVGIDWTTEARYLDQAWEIEVPLRASRIESADDLATLVADFHDTHQEIFAVSDPGAEVEMIGWNATIRCRIGSPAPGRLAAPGAPGAAPPARQVYFAGTGWVAAEVHDFDRLAADTEITGPGIVESGFTSVVIDPGARARRDAGGTLIIAVR